MYNHAFEFNIGTYDGKCVLCISYMNICSCCKISILINDIHIYMRYLLLQVKLKSAYADVDLHTNT